MHSKERIAKAMTDAGCPDHMIVAAREGMFDDFESPLPMPKFALTQELRAAKFFFLAERVEGGEFDNTKAEGEAWYAEHGENEAREFFKSANNPFRGN